MKKILLILTVIASMPSLAQQDVYKLAQGKAGKLTEVRSSQGISLMTEKSYDKYIISISGHDNYSHQFESDAPRLNLYDLNLPYNGSYNYEIKAVKYIADIKDTMNNGRAEDAVGKVSHIDVKSGQFISNYGEMVNVADSKEPTKNSLPQPKNQ